jgi:hypothetical protein
MASQSAMVSDPEPLQFPSKISPFFFLTNFNTRTYIIGVGNSWQKMRNSLQVSQKRLMLHHSAGSDGL